MSASQPQAYQLKTIRYQNAPTKILLQNENGPCPLLAAANALLLRGAITLDPVCIRNGVASTEDVVNMLANRAIAAGGNNAEAEKLVTTTSNNNTMRNSHHEFHLNEVLSLLPNLQHGMDVNPKFTSGPTGVEYTNNLAAFDLLGVELVHGWLLDPQDVETSSVVENKTYNELIETVIHGNEARDAVQKLEKELMEKQKLFDSEVVASVNHEGVNTGGKDKDAEASGQHLEQAGDTKNSELPKPDHTLETKSEVDSDQANEGATQRKEDKEQSSGGPTTGEGSSTDANQTDETDATTTASKPTDGHPVEDANTIALQKEIIEMREKMSDLSLQISRAESANDFLTSSGHQLTYHGLEQLHNHMGNDTMSVFFRNNHFATLTKHDGVLYLLATDLGYANTPEIVWEKIDNIDGNTEYVNEFFAKPAPREELKPASGPTIAPELLLAQRSQAESDFQLALAMSKGTATTGRMDDDESKLLEAAKELSLKTYNGDNAATVGVGAASNCATNNTNSQVDSDLEIALAYQRAQQQSEHESEQLARQLQNLEYARQRPQTAASPSRRSTRLREEAKSSTCTIS